jgi:hypothetical protein
LLNNYLERNLVDIIKGLTPAIAGSVVAFILSHDHLTQRLGRFVVSIPIGFYGGPVASKWISMSDSVAMFFVGAFGLLILSKLYDGIQSIDAASVLTSWIKK